MQLCEKALFSRDKRKGKKWRNTSNPPLLGAPWNRRPLKVNALCVDSKHYGIEWLYCRNILWCLLYLYTYTGVLCRVLTSLLFVCSILRLRRTDQLQLSISYETEENDVTERRNIRRVFIKNWTWAIFLAVLIKSDLYCFKYDIHISTLPNASK